MLLIAGDIGGTTSRFQILDTDATECFPTTISYSSPEFSSFAALLRHLFDDQNIRTQVDAACFGLPGPVAEQQVELTNLPWKINVADLKRDLPLIQVKLVNDFYAAAMGVDLLAADELCCLYPGQHDPDGNRLVIGAGTGLGVAPIYQIDGKFYPQPSEGGHMDFAPLNHEQEDLLSWLHIQWDHVSYENLLSGEGLENLYRYSMQRIRSGMEIGYISAPQVHRLAQEGDPVALKAMRMFVNIYGEFVGNTALLWPARAGIYISGGIGAKIVDWMKSREFVSYFLNKGTMRPLVEKMPVYLVMDDLMGLKGAMLIAQHIIFEEQE